MYSSQRCLVCLSDDLEELGRCYLLGVGADELEILPNFDLHGRLLLQGHRHELLRLLVVEDELISRELSPVVTIEHLEDLQLHNLVYTCHLIRLQILERNIRVQKQLLEFPPRDGWLGNIQKMYNTTVVLSSIL